MKKAMIGTLCSLALSLGAYAQTNEVNIRHEERGPAVGQHERVQTKTEMRGTPRQIHRMQRDSNREIEHSNRVIERGDMDKRADVRVENKVETRGDRFFFGGRELHRRGDFDRNDMHFRIGNHPRVWWTQHYSNVVLINGCWYYEDSGFFYPAYGYDPDCSYPDTYVVFTFGD